VLVHTVLFLSSTNETHRDLVRVVLRENQNSMKCWHFLFFLVRAGSFFCVRIMPRTKRSASSAELKSNERNVVAAVAGADEDVVVSVSYDLEDVTEAIKRIPDHSAVITDGLEKLTKATEKLTTATERIAVVNEALLAISQKHFGYNSTDFPMRVLVVEIDDKDGDRDEVRHEDIIVGHASLDWTVATAKRVISKAAESRVDSMYIDDDFPPEGAGEHAVMDDTQTLRACGMCTADTLRVFIRKGYINPES